MLSEREGIDIPRHDHEEGYGHIEPERKIILKLLFISPREVRHDNKYDTDSLKEIYKMISIRFRSFFLKL